MENKTALDKVANAIQEIPVLKRNFASVIRRAYADSELAARIVSLICKHEYVLQTKIGEMLGVAGADSSRVVHTLRNLQFIDAIKSGRTNELRLTKKVHVSQR